MSRRQQAMLGLMVLMAGVAMAGGLAIWRWSRHNRSPVAWRRPTSHDPAGIIVHHSDTPGVIRSRYVGAALIDRSHQRRGFRVRYKGKVYHIGYHYVIREDGVIEPGRPEHCPGAHSKHHNDYLGICLVGNFSPAHNPHRWTPSEPTDAQLQSLVWLCGRLMTKYHIPPDRVMRHCDVRETACPGDRFPFTWLQASLQYQWRAAGLPSGPPVDRVEDHLGRRGNRIATRPNGGEHGASAFSALLLRAIALPFRR